eukprot:2126518-Prorocentrum_lima.AAC.1
MTSSLVGSEMCIRDRQSKATPSEAKTSKAKQSTATQRDAKQSKAKAKPVSYTHLTLPTICSV